jgi:hypothetical protein
MPNKIALLLTIILVIVDVNLIYDFINQPLTDTHHGGLGWGLFQLYAFGVEGLLVLYLLIFLILYFMKRFTAARAMCWILLGLNVFFGGWILLVMLDKSGQEVYLNLSQGSFILV